MSVVRNPRRLACDHTNYRQGATSAARDIVTVPCGQEFLSPAPSAAALRSQAKDAGWISRASKDYCPSHGAALRIRDTTAAFGRTR